MTSPIKLRNVWHNYVLSICIIFVTVLGVLLTAYSPVYASEELPEYYSDPSQFVSEVLSQLRVVRRTAMNEMYFTTKDYDYWVYKDSYDSVLPYIVEALYDEDYQTRILAAEAFENLVKDSATYLYVNVSYELHNDLTDEVVIRLLHSFEGAQGIGGEFGNALMIWANSENEDVRYAVLFALKQFIGGQNDEFVMPMVESMLNDPSDSIVIYAVSTLISMGEKSPLLRTKLEKISESDNESLALRAKELLEKLE